jgi:hypothetical protein
MSLTSTIDSDEDIVATWLKKKRAYDVAPVPVFKAHLDLNGQGCESDGCPICWVYSSTDRGKRCQPNDVAEVERD